MLRTARRVSGQARSDLGRRRAPPSWKGGTPSRDHTPFLTPARTWAVVLLLLLTVLALFSVWQSWQRVYWLNELHRSQEDLAELQASHERLRFEVGRAFSLERIERLAMEELRMIRPSPDFLVLPLTP